MDHSVHSKFIYLWSSDTAHNKTGALKMLDVKMTDVKLQDMKMQDIKEQDMKLTQKRWTFEAE